jgi:adenylosuccinate synthase
MDDVWIVVDLGFGDAGKGSVTDFLVRERKAGLVVRFSGGAQAGHNVVTPDGRHHTFSQFCAGSFAGARGLLGPDFLLHPLGMSVEAEHLVHAGVPDPWALTEVDRRARVITPYQQAAGRLRESLRGAEAHGTTGVGVGECAADALSHPDDALCAGDLRDLARVRRRLSAQRERKREQMRELGATDLSLFDDPGLVARVLEAWRQVGARLQLLEPEQTLARVASTRCVIFEGAQGVLLDEGWGFHPHTTWSDCTPAGAQALLGERPARRLGVTRAYAVRHGAGPFPTEGTLAVRERHNSDEGWQGRFRVGALDLVLLRYALAVCGKMDALAVTCLDRLPSPLVCEAYRGEGPPELVRTEAGRVVDLVPGARGDLAHQERLGQWLRGAVPDLAMREPIAALEQHTGLQVQLTSHGPGPQDKRWRKQ